VNQGSDGIHVAQMTAILLNISVVVMSVQELLDGLTDGLIIRRDNMECGALLPCHIYSMAN
jgi:hypothetical protein